MTLIRPTHQVAGPSGTVRRSANGRTVALLGLVALGGLIPLLGPSAALNGTQETAATTAPGTALLRAVLFAALSVPVGELLVERLARGVPGASPARPRSWSPHAALAGLGAALGLAWVVVVGGPGAHGVDAFYGSRTGRLALVEVDAFLLAALYARSRRPAARLLPSVTVIVAEALRAHPAAEHTALLGSGLTLVHLSCAALWTGGLLCTLRVLRHWGPVAAGQALLGRYARVAAVLLAAVTATGVCSSLRRMPSDALLEALATTAYGRVLLAKTLLVAAVALLALWARTRLRRAADPLSACSPARVEVVVLGAVVAVSGLLTALPPPVRRF